MFPTSLLLNLMVFIYDIEKSSVNNVVLILSFLESITILIPIPMTLVEGIKFEQVLIPRSIALFMDLLLMLYVNWQLTPVLRVTQDPNLKLFRLRWNLCFYTVVFNNLFVLLFNLITIIQTTAYYVVPFFSVMILFTMITQTAALITVINVFMKGPLLVGSIAEFKDSTGTGSIKAKNV